MSDRRPEPLSAWRLWLGQVPRSSAPTPTGRVARVERIIGRMASRNGWLLYATMVGVLCWCAAEVTVGVLFAAGEL